MGAIEQIATAEAFQAGTVYGNTAEYRSVKRTLTEVADRLTGLLGNMGIEGRAADAIDQSITALVTNIRERSDNVDQFANARNTATEGGSTAGNKSQSIQPTADTARRMTFSSEPETVMLGERMLQRLETEARVALSALQARTDQAIQELPTIFPKDDPVSSGGGGQAVNQRATPTQAQHSAGYAVRPPQSATQWIPQQPAIDSTPLGAGSRASISSSPVNHTSPEVSRYIPQPTVNPGAVSEQVSQPVYGRFPTANDAYIPSQSSATAATNVPYTPSQSEGMGLGVARAAAGAAALPAMAKAVSRAQSAMRAAPRGGGSAIPRAGQPSATARAAAPRASTGGSTARTAAPRGGMPARGAGAPSPRSGAATRPSSAANRGSIAPRAGQGAATRAGTPARAASARGTGASRSAGSGSGKGAAPARGSAARATAARATAARGATSASRAQATSRSASASQGRGAPVARGGVTAPRQGAARAATGRGMMAGRPLAGSGKKKRDSRQSLDSFSAVELQEDSTITFIEAGHRED